jgi:restriction endonuclease Mrr
MNRINKVEADKFEVYCADLLLRERFKSIKVKEKIRSKNSNLYEFDVTAEYGFLPKHKIYVECKYYNLDFKVSEKEINHFVSKVESIGANKFLGFKRLNKIFMTTSYFTRNAVNVSEDRKVLLFDRDMIELYRHKNIGFFRLIYNRLFKKNEIWLDKLEKDIGKIKL